MNVSLVAVFYSTFGSLRTNVASLVASASFTEDFYPRQSENMLAEIPPACMTTCQRLVDLEAVRSFTNSSSESVVPHIAFLNVRSYPHIELLKQRQPSTMRMHAFRPQYHRYVWYLYRSGAYRPAGCEPRSWRGPEQYGRCEAKCVKILPWAVTVVSPLRCTH